MKKWILVLIILALAAFLRFYRLPDLFIFGGDEEYQSILAQTIVNNFHIIWIGVTAGHFGFYLGPFWTYFTSLLLFLSKGDPLITGYISSLLGVCTTALIIYTGNKLFGKGAGLISGLLYATSALLVYFDQKFWNPSLVPMISVGMLLSLAQVKQNPKWWLVFFSLFGLIFHVHLSLMPFGLIALFILLRKKTYSIFSRNIFLGLFLFLLIYSPLIFFDYFHKGSNITTPLRFKEFSSAESVRINPQRHFEVLFQTLGRVWYLIPNTSNADNVLYACSPFAYFDNNALVASKISTRTIPPFWLSLASFIILIWFVIYSFKNNNFNQRLLSSAILLIISAYLFLPVATHEYYLLSLFPLLLFLPSILVKSLEKNLSFLKQIIKKVLQGLIIVIPILGIITILTTRDDFGLSYKKKMLGQILNIVQEGGFEIEQKGLCHHYGGWRYLFKQAGKPPLRSSSDESLGWLYENEISSKPADYKIIFVEARYPKEDEIKNAKTISEGGFKAYIIKNSK